MKRRAVFLDRDGVLNALVYRPVEGIYDSPYSLDEFHLLPRVPEAVCLINGLGFAAVVVSNQPGVAKGKCAEEFLAEMSRELTRRLGEGGAFLDAIAYCTHHPEAQLERYRRDCECRKPKPGLLIAAAQAHKLDLQRSYMVGDTNRDITAGRAAGCTTILVQTGVVPTAPLVKPDLVVRDLLAAVHAIAEQEG